MENATESLAAIYLKSVRKRFAEYKNLGDKTLAQLSETQLLYQPNTASNSIAIIIQHMHGNMLSRWTNFLTEDGEKEWRNRDAEFNAQALSKQQLEQLWNDGWAVVFTALDALQEHDLLKNITIRQQPLSVVDAINRQLAHYSYHVGQMVYMGKWLTGEGWKTLTIPKGNSQQYTEALIAGNKDPL